MKTEETVWYHGSFHLMQVGDIVQVGEQPENFSQSSKTLISITSERNYASIWGMRAAMMQKRPAREPIYIYTVVPLDEVIHHRKSPGGSSKPPAYYESRTARAQVVKVETMR